MNNKKLILVAVIIAALVAAYFAFGLGHYLTLDYLKSQQAAIDAYVTGQPVAAALVFFVLYIAVTGLSLPGAAIMTLAAGAIFGLAWGTVIVSFASRIGATLAFLASRYLFRDAIQRRYGDRLHAFDAGMARDGAFYLFTLRLVPAFPFFLINLVMGLTPIRTWTYYWVSQIGMLAGTLGVRERRHSARAHRYRCAASCRPALIGSFVLLGVFPLIAQRVDCRRARAQGAAPVAAPAQLRSQRRRHRRRIRGTRIRVHRRGGESESHARRKTPHGRRLSQHRLRAVESVDTLGAFPAQPRGRALARHALGERGMVVRRGHGARAARGAHRRAARFGRALRGARRRMRGRHGENPHAVQRRSDDARRQANAHHAHYRDRCWRASLRTAHSRHRQSRRADFRYRVVLARAAETAGRPRRRPDRLRARSSLRPPRRSGDANRNAAAFVDARRPGDFGARAGAVPRRRHRCASRPQGAAVRDRRRREGDLLRDAGDARCALRSMQCCAPWAALRTPTATGSKSSAYRRRRRGRSK